VSEQEPRQNWLRREWRLLVGLALSAICLYLALRGISLPALKEALSVATWGWVAAAVAVVVAGTFLKARRWQVLFYPRQIAYRHAWPVFVIGQMLNAVLPARAGEIGRIYLIGEVEPVSRAKALSTVIVEKLVDLVMLALSYLAVVIWLSTTSLGLPDWLQRAGASMVPLAALALGGLLLFAYAGRPLWRLLKRLLNPLPLRWQDRANQAAEQAIAGFESLRHWQVSVQVWGLSLAIWILSTVTNAWLFRAFYLDLPASAALFLLVVLMVGVAIPPLPGNLGVFPYLCQLALSLFGVSRETALIYGLILQLTVYLPLIVAGALCLSGGNWSLRRSSPETPGSRDAEERG